MQTPDDPHRAGGEPGPEPGGEAAIEAATAEALGALVDEAARGTPSSLERLLLRTLVDLGLTEAAALWDRVAATDRWTRVRSFGGATPAPAPGFATPRARDFELSRDRRIVTLRDPFDVDGRRAQREDTIESLVALAASLVDALGGADGLGPGALPRAS